MELIKPFEPKLLEEIPTEELLCELLSRDDRDIKSSSFYPDEPYSVKQTMLHISTETKFNGAIYIDLINEWDFYRDFKFWASDDFAGNKQFPRECMRLFATRTDNLYSQDEDIQHLRHRQRRVLRILIEHKAVECLIVALDEAILDGEMVMWAVRHSGELLSRQNINDIIEHAKLRARITRNPCEVQSCWGTIARLKQYQEKRK